MMSIDAVETQAFYQAQDSLWLVKLRHAFKRDLELADTEVDTAYRQFCEERIAIIDQLLKDRDRAGVEQR